MKNNLEQRTEKLKITKTLKEGLNVVKEAIFPYARNANADDVAEYFLTLAVKNLMKKSPLFNQQIEGDFDKLEEQ